MGMDQMVYAHPETWLNATGGGSGSGGITQPLDADSRGRGAREADAARDGLDEARRAGREPVGRRGRRLGRRQDRHLRRPDRRQDVQGPADHGEHRGRARARSAASARRRTARIPVSRTIAKPVSQYTVVGKSFPRIDIPAKVAATYTYIQNVHIPGMVHAPRRAAARRRREHVGERQPGERRRELDQPHPGRSGRADRQLDRRRRAEGVRRDPGGRAAEGDLEERSEAAGLGQLLGLAPPGRRHEQGEPGALHEHDARQRRHGAEGRRQDGVRDLQVPLQRVHADRPARRGRRRRREGEPGDGLRPGAVASGSAREPRRRDRLRGRRQHAARERARGVVRGRVVVRRRPDRRGQRAGRGAVGQARRAGARAVDALGPARLGPLRHGQHVGRQDGRRREGQHRRLGLADLRPGPVEHRPDQAAVGHGFVAGGTRERRHRAAGHGCTASSRRGRARRGCSRRRSRCTAVRSSATSCGRRALRSSSSRASRSWTSSRTR